MNAKALRKYYNLKTIFRTFSCVLFVSVYNRILYKIVKTRFRPLVDFFNHKSKDILAEYLIRPSLVALTFDVVWRRYGESKYKMDCFF